MPMDKSWINLRNHLSDEYFNGARAFIEIAKNYPNEEGLIWCPCRKCCNGLWQRIGVVEAHIIDIGFNPIYKTWRYHGKPDDVVMMPFVNEQVVNSGDEILNMLEDVIGPTHELPTENDALENYEDNASQKE